MKRKSNIFLLFLTVFFLIFSSNVTQAATITLSRPQPAASGKFVASGKYWTYQYDDKTIAKNEFLKIGKRTYYFNKYGYRWYGWHTVNGKKYYFGTRSQGYLFRNSLIHYKGDYYYAGKDGAAITGWCTDASGRKPDFTLVAHTFSVPGVLFAVGIFFLCIFLRILRLIFCHLCALLPSAGEYRFPV